MGYFVHIIIVLLDFSDVSKMVPFLFVLVSTERGRTFSDYEGGRHPMYYDYCYRLQVAYEVYTARVTIHKRARL